jgi:hypothetical protein
MAAAQIQDGQVRDNLVATKSASSSYDATHPLDEALKLALESLQHSQTHVRDYTAVLTKRCRIGGELSDYQQAYIKIRNPRSNGDTVITPMSVYMKFLRPSQIKGREVIWVDGRNDGQIIAHDVGLKRLLRVKLDPNGPIAMRGQRYPITEIGLEKLVQQMIERGNRDRRYNDCQVKISDGASVAKRSCRLVWIEHPVKRPYFDFYRAHVFFDDELKLPVRYASWSWPLEPDAKPVLEEEYTYTHIKINVGLEDLDFDPENPEYDFW